MKVLVVGGSGFVGARLVGALRARGDEVVVTGRSAARLEKQFGAGVGCVEWDPNRGPLPLSELAGVDGVVNLAGEPVHKGRWNKAKKERILQSRVVGTKHLVAALASAEPKPRVLVNASAIGWYGDRKHNWVHEDYPPAKDYLAEVCQAWEAEARRAREASIRTAIVRLGVVLGKDGGAYPEMAKPFRIFAGGQIGLGKMWMSWVHVDDVAGLFLYCLDSEQAVGVYNATAPNPVSNMEFSDTLGNVLKRPVPFYVPVFMLRLMKGEFAHVITASIRARPLRTLAVGYEFKFPRLREALLDIEGKAAPSPPQATPETAPGD
ncbi:MAG: TIGR01777 family oxidoreductase [Planctomycetota bacterium]|jgi:uncharacterized protein (TIGR01777 family)